MKRSVALSKRAHRQAGRGLMQRTDTWRTVGLVGRAIPMRSLRLVPYWSVHETLGVDAHNAPLKMRTRRIHLSRAVAWSCVRRHPVAGAALGSTDVEGSDPPVQGPGTGSGAGVFAHLPPPSWGRSRAIDPSRKGVGPMRPATLAIIGTALGAAAGHAFRAPFPGMGDNPVLDLIAYHDPGLHTVIRVWYYTATAVAVVLAGSLCLSVWRVWLQPRARRRGRGRLPAWPTSPNDAAALAWSFWARAVPDLSDPQQSTIRQLVSSRTSLKEHLRRAIAIRNKSFSMGRE